MYWIIDKNGDERIAYAEDFQDTTITLTPEEWHEMIEMFEYRRKTYPNPLAKAQKSILKKCLENEPKIKEGNTIIRDTRKEK